MYTFDFNSCSCHAVKDCEDNKDGLWVMVCVKDVNGIPEEDYSIDFCIHPEDCDIKSNRAVYDTILDRLDDIVSANIKLAGKDRNGLLMEAAIDITSQAYDRLTKAIGDDVDSREVVGIIRDWAEEFESWWWLVDEGTRDEYTDYLSAVDTFTENKLKEYENKEYSVRLEVYLSTYITVKAANEQEATELALKKSESLESHEWTGWDNGVYVDSVEEN